MVSSLPVSNTAAAHNSGPSRVQLANLANIAVYVVTRIVLVQLSGQASGEFRLTPPPPTSELFFGQGRRGIVPGSTKAGHYGLHLEGTPIAGGSDRSSPLRSTPTDEPAVSYLTRLDRFLNDAASRWADRGAHLANAG
jgi:hypothetical protein